MLPQTAPPRISYQDYLECSPPDKAFTIIDGNVFRTPAPNLSHQKIVLRLGSLLLAYANDHGGLALVAPVDVVLDEWNVVQPDVIYVSEARIPVIVTEKAVLGAPDLAVEVLSPSTTRQDRLIKFQLYARFGVRHFWIVDPRAGTLEAYELLDNLVYRPAVSLGAGQVFRPVLFPGLEIDLARVTRS